MPQFIYLLRNSVEPSGPPMTADQRAKLIADYQAWAERLGDRLRSGERLARKTGRRIRRRSDKLSLIDGPYVESKEIVGGFWLVEADDLDHAARLTEGLPFGQGELEIREIEA